MSTQPLTGPEPLGCDECYDPGCPGVAAQEEAFEARFEAEASLTPAEAAVVAVLSGESECSWHIGCDEECHADRARAVVAAVQEPIEQQIGRDLLDDGIESVLMRLLGEANAVFVLNVVRAEAVEDAAREEFGSTLTADGAIRSRLYAHAKKVRATPLPGSPLAQSLSRPTSEETRNG